MPDRHTGVLRNLPRWGVRASIRVQSSLRVLASLGPAAADSPGSKPSHPGPEKSLKRACGGPGDRAMAWFKGRPESSSLRPIRPQDARHPARMTRRRSSADARVPRAKHSIARYPRVPRYLPARSPTDANPQSRVHAFPSNRGQICGGDRPQRVGHLAAISAASCPTHPSLRTTRSDRARAAASAVHGRSVHGSSEPAGRESAAAGASEAKHTQRGLNGQQAPRTLASLDRQTARARPSCAQPIRKAASPAAATTT